MPNDTEIEVAAEELIETVKQQAKTIEMLCELIGKDKARYDALEERWSRSFEAIKEGLAIIHEPLPTKEKYNAK